MIKHSFIHMQGVGKSTEEKLWARGITSWDLFEAAHKAGEKLPQATSILRHIAISREKLAKGDLLHFQKLFSASDAWRLYPGFEAKTCFLDIETTGDGQDCDITTIALYDGQEVRTYVNGENLHQFKDDILAYDTLVTYNGKSFDAPVIRRVLSIPLEMAHIDLRYVLGNLGIKGGLKKCEDTLGLGRTDLAGVDGYAAVVMWDAYHRTGDRRYLETLLTYNVVDTVNLEPLLIKACQLHMRSLPSGIQVNLPQAGTPDYPYSADAEVISEMRAMCSTPRRNIW